MEDPEPSVSREREKVSGRQLLGTGVDYAVMGQVTRILERNPFLVASLI
jgi:hypothetical protein